jgi:hypothetical protein
MTVLTPDFRLVSADEVTGVSETEKFIAVIANAFQGVESFPLANIVYNTPELLSSIVQYCDHFTSMSISRVSRHGRAAAQAEIRCRMRLIFQPFIPTASFDSFVDMLDRTGSVVYGSVVRRLLMSNSIFEQDLDTPSRATFDSSGDFNISCPRGMEDECRFWFSARGYESEKRGGGQPAPGFCSVMSNFVQLWQTNTNSDEVSNILLCFVFILNYSSLCASALL